MKKEIIANYNDEDIQTLAPLEGIRAKLGMYIGGNGNDAVHHVIKEIVSNSIDEYLAGFGLRIDLHINTQNNAITIRDYARGIPLGKVDTVFTKVHASGKFDKKDGGAYGASGGLNGVGLKTATASGLVQVEVIREGKKFANQYTYNTVGKATTSNIDKKTPSGTKITWTPDEGVFTDKNIKLENVRSLLEDLSYLTPGLEFHLSQDDKKPEIIKAKGIEDFIKDYVTAHDMVSPIMTFKKGDASLMIEGAMVWTKKQNIEQTYMNLIPTSSGGTHLTAAKTTLTKSTNKLLNFDFTGEELRRGWVIILSVKCKEEVVFKGQDKSAVNMPSINAPLSALIRSEFERLIEQNLPFFEKYKTMIQSLRKRDNTEVLLKALTAKPKTNALSDITSKYKGCSAQTGIELFLAEGQSAQGAIALTKSHIDQAVFAERGKIKNVLEEDLEAVLKNDEIKALIELIGPEDEALKKYSRIFLAADKDDDGQQIIVLNLAFFAKFYPKLLLHKKVYMLEMPLFMATHENGTQEFFDDPEKAKTFSKSWVISRFKGLIASPYSFFR